MTFGCVDRCRKVERKKKEYDGGERCAVQLAIEAAVFAIM
jgi:hypothetical protein